MTVGEFKAALNKHPDNLEVFFDVEIKESFIDFDDWVGYIGMRRRMRSFYYRDGERKQEEVVEIKLKY